MTVIQRRRLRRNVILTVLLTVLALTMEWGGNLGRLERVFYNLRVVFCRRARPTTDRIVHLDIDDLALDQIGRWPWDRSVVAGLLDEVRLAGAKVVAMDILFSEPSRKTYDRNGQLIDEDGRLAEAIQKSGDFLIATSLNFDLIPPPTPTQARLTNMLIADPEMTVDQSIAMMVAKGFNSPALADEVKNGFVRLRPEAIHTRIKREIEAGGADKAKIRIKILPHFDPLVATSADRIFNQEFDRVLQERSMSRFTIPMRDGLPPILQASNAITPILPLSNAAKYGAFVDYVPDVVDGTIRFVPLMAVYRDRLVPHLGLALACAMLNVNVRDLRLSRDSITIPQPAGKDIVIPVRVRPSLDRTVSMLMEIPVFGRKEGWAQMYDYPQFKESAQHVSLYKLLLPILTRQRIAANEFAADRILVDALKLSDEKAAADYAAAPLTGPAKRLLIDTTLTNLAELIKGLSSVADLDPETKKLLETYKTSDRLLREVIRQNALLNQQLLQLRDELHRKLAGRAALIGFTATGSTDVVPTSLHARCPGVVVHGMIFNAIMTRNMWRVASPNVTHMAVVIMGLLTGLLVARLSPLKAFFAMAILVGGYLALNGFVLFMFGNLIVGVTGPMLASLIIWSGITIPNFITEVAERNRITRRFSNYVDPSLVNYVIEHPEQARFDGEAREMTMGFTDLMGFTTFTESLGPRTVPLLAEYMNHMIPRIRENKGYVSRLMGDGIYFFFNAPGADPDHATHAVMTVLSMHEALDRMNLTLPARDYPILTMRAGLCTGKVIVGDAGSKDFKDYTAVGDSVNTAARFESANKNFGTKIMASARTIELLNGQFLIRPIGNLRVVGKTEGRQVFEPLCRLDAATPRQLQIAEISTNLVGAYQKGDFAGCIAAADQLDRLLGPTKYAAFYRLICLEYQEKPPIDFCGQIVLTEK